MFDTNPVKKLEKISKKYSKARDLSTWGMFSPNPKALKLLEEAYSVMDSLLYEKTSFIEDEECIGYTLTNKPHHVFDLDVLDSQAYLPPKKNGDTLKWEDILGSHRFHPSYNNGDFELEIQPNFNSQFFVRGMLFARGNSTFKQYLDLSPKGGALEKLQVSRPDYAWRGDILLPVYSKESREELTAQFAESQKKLLLPNRDIEARKELEKLDDILGKHLNN